MSDPCFRCVLPDCDEASPQCALRQMERRYWNKVRAGRRGEVTPEERSAHRAMDRIYAHERLAQAAEGIRPCGHDGSRWKPGQPFQPDRES